MLRRLPAMHESTGKPRPQAQGSPKAAKSHARRSGDR
jgi:hypothetical protein